MATMVFASATVPFLVSLSPADVAMTVQPPPLFVTLPRRSSLCALWSLLQPHFRQYVASVGASGADGVQYWLEHASAGPVPWQYPVGAIADRCNTLLGPSEFTPIELVAHVGAAPKKSYCVTLQTQKDCQILVQQHLKAALAIMFCDTRPFFKLSSKKTVAVVSAALAENGGCDETERSAWEEMHKHGGDVLAWPVCVHVIRVTRSGGSDAVFTERVAFRAIPNEANSTFADLLRVCDGMLPKSANLEARGSIDEPFIDSEQKIRVVVNGLSPLLSTPVTWLMQNLASADGFLHMLVEVRELE